MESNTTVSNLGFEVVSGGQVGVETVIQGKVNFLSDIMSDIFTTVGKSGAVVNVFCQWLITDPNGRMLQLGKDSAHATDYQRNNTPAHAELDWDCDIVFTFVPEIAGEYLIGIRGCSDNSYQNQKSIFEDYGYRAEYFLVRVDIGPKEINPQDFQVTVGQDTQSFSWDWPNLTEDVEFDNVVAQVSIPNGTMILGTGKLVFDDAGNLLEPEDAVFSDTVTITYGGNTWTFSEIINGVLI